MLTPAMLRSGTLCRLTDERIEAEETGYRTRAERQAALHLQDLRRHVGTPLKSLWLKGEDMGRLVR